MSPTIMVSVLEQSRVSTPAGENLPLNFFDLEWLYFPPVQRLLLYEFPHSKTHFTETTIPKLKQSLPIVLKHFFPMAGKLVIPTNSCMPHIRYSNGDSVLLIFAESSADFSDLVGNHSRSAGDLQSLVPSLPDVTCTPESWELQVLAVQVTLFPNSGVSIGITTHHAVGDARSVYNFVSAWALITKTGGDSEFLANGSLPFYDKTVIKDQYGLDTTMLNQVGRKPPVTYHPQNVQNDEVRSTFVMDRSDIQKLKKFALTRRPKPVRLSSFTVVCGYVWSCLIQARQPDRGELQHIICPADLRTRLIPPVPETYFGNCLGPCIATTNIEQLKGGDGFVTATEKIGEAIQKRVFNEEGVVKGAEKWMSEIHAAVMSGRLVGVTGSPKFNYYTMDFGWGKPKKFEYPSVKSNAISLCGCRDEEGGIEVGLCLNKAEMNIFAAVFIDGLKLID